MNHPRCSTSNNAFTLVELSIVLTILALIAGGAVTAKTIIRSSELRSLVAQEQQYEAAVSDFKDKYGALPGDIPTAYDLWPSSGCTNAVAVVSDDSGCNGDGDGLVFSNSSYERLRFWQHLALAGMIPGTYSGSYLPSGSSSNSDFVGVNVPATKISEVGFGIQGFSSAVTPGYRGMYGGASGQYFTIGKKATANLTLLGTMIGLFLLPDEAYSIDTKSDDGLPTQGKWQVFVGSALNPVNINCTNNTTTTRQTSDVYNVSYGSPACAFNVKPF